MAAITWTDVSDLASELSAVATTARTLILALVNAKVDVESLDGEAGELTKAVRVYYAAHLGALSLQGSGAWTGAVVSESAGGLSRSYASNSPNGTSPLWDKTPYGQTLRALLRTSGARAPFAINGGS